MSFGGHNPYQPPGTPHGNPYQPPLAPNGNPYATPPGTPPQVPYVPPQPSPYGPYPYGPRPPHTSLWRRLREDEWPTLGEVLRGGRQRVHGCVWALLLMPCLWGMTLPLLVCYPLARSARSRARRLFPARGHRRIEDPEVARVQKARAWTAAVMSFLILIAYGTPEDMAQAQQQYWTRLMITPWLLLLSAPVVVAVLLRWAPPDARGVMRHRLRAAGRSALWYFGAFGLVPVLALAGGWTTARLTEGASVGAAQVFLVPLLFFGAFVPMLWVVLFVVFASGPAVRSAFNTAEVHAALPALLTGVLVWEFAAIGLVAGGPPPGPPAIQLFALLGGPASVTAVAWWEIHLLRTRYGVVLRG
ncbi:hypothetical protein ACFWR9_28575 [Streptomyces sp. NPDC058534]|uniref:hypothetical protein n=1 Tax=Streptomyces sp. NPDC058534 TaxID=3346541 RepID=UPI0036495920